MVYKWEPHRETCYRLYVEQKKSLDEVMDYLRAAHNFTPSRRGYQVQFRRWAFPTKYKRAWKNEQLVARVKELWGRNLSQKEMMQQLRDDGYDIELRQLIRLRYRHGLRLRETVGAFGGLRSNSADGEGDEEDGDDGGGDGDGDGDGDGGGESSESDDSESDDSESGDDDDADADGDHDEGEPVELQLQQQQHPQPPVVAAELPGGNGGLTPAQLARKEERRRAMEAKNMETLATKKRRRHTKPFAGLPADPPGPPRFPSETTLEESKEILQLDAASYKTIRQRFVSMCEASGVAKKSTAGPEKWEALKDQLVRESMHLRAVMWDQENMDKKRLAIDVIACDVTKRMRVSVMTIAEAKTVLGLNPEQGREIRASLYKILTEDQFTCRTEEGQEHWEELKRTWYAGSELLQRLIAPTGSDEDDRRMAKAIETLARDVVRRYRDDHFRRNKAPLDAPPKARKPPKTKPKPKHKSKPKAKAPSPSSSEDSSPDFVFDSMPNPTTPTRQQPVRSARSLAQRSRQVQQASITHTHTQSRLLPPEMLSSPSAGISPMDAHSQLSTALLLSPSPQNPFIDDHRQYTHDYPVPTVADVQPPPPVYHHHHQHQPQPTVPISTPSATIGIYFRLHPSSSVFPGTVMAPMWIATLASRSIGELRAAAVERFEGGAGVVCVAIEGVIKDGKGGELPLPVSDDAELATYLQHVQNMMAPTFNVQLVEAGARGVWGV